MKLQLPAAILIWFLASSLPAQENGDVAALRSTALDLTNAAREEAGLSELRSDDILDQAAQDHAADMLARGYFNHVSPDGTTPFDRFIAAGGSRWAVSGENIATCEGCETPPDVDRVTAFHDGWMQSPGHRKNILSNGFQRFGFGIAADDDSIYAVQTFSGSGGDRADGDTSGLSAASARQEALEQMNAVRRSVDLAPLIASEDLDMLAERVLATLDDDADTLPENIFELLPEGSSGWTSLALQTASIGGSGVTVDRDDLSKVISDWVPESGANQTFGGEEASHAGFAAANAGDGRLSAVAVFAGR
jgi:uncharacterized protein YkwD